MYVCMNMCDKCDDYGNAYRMTTVADDSTNDTLHAMAEWQPGKQCVLALHVQH